MSKHVQLRLLIAAILVSVPCSIWIIGLILAGPTDALFIFGVIVVGWSLLILGLALGYLSNERYHENAKMIELELEGLHRNAN